MSANHEPLRKLIGAACKAQPLAPAPTDMTAPFGFSTRVAARWAAARGRSSPVDAWERLSWWGAGASVALCLLVFVGQSSQPDPNPFEVLIEAQGDAGEALDMI
jgi:hypothetical protein